MTGLEPVWRGFGTAAGLGIDFAASRPEAVTQVLAACWDDGVEAAMRLTLAGRIGGLAAILDRTGGDGTLPVTLRCAACNEAMATAVPLSAVSDMAADAAAQPVLTLPHPAGGTLRLRRPTGEDQRRWRSREYATETEAAGSILASLTAEGAAPVGSTALAAIGEALAEADPLPCFHIGTSCPACDTAAEMAIDLEGALLARLAQRQGAMLDEVHALASGYGWTEAEVMAVPPRRRRAYLARLQALPA